MPKAVQRNKKSQTEYAIPYIIIEELSTSDVGFMFSKVDPVWIKQLLIESSDTSRYTGQRSTIAHHQKPPWTISRECQTKKKRDEKRIQ